MDAMFEESPIQEISSDCILPAPLTQLYDDKYKAYSQKELLEKAEQLFYQISITDEEVAAVEERTRKQKVSPDWHEQRHGRITLSAFHDVWVRKDTTNPDRLAQQILYDSNDLSVIPVVQWGIENEGHASSTAIYYLVMQTSSACTSAGLVIITLYTLIWVQALMVLFLVTAMAMV